MATPIFSNFGRTTLAGTINAGDPSPVTFNVSDGSVFPSPGAGQYFPVVLTNSAGQREVMQCTSRTGNSLTCTRPAEGTTARTFVSGDVIGCRMTSGALSDLATLGTSVSATEASVSAASTTDLGATAMSVAVSSGTGTIDNFTVYSAGTKRLVRATGAFNITTAGNITCPGGVALSVAAGDVFWVESVGATWVIGPYQRGAVSPASTSVTSVNGSSGAVVVNPGFSRLVVLTGSGNWVVPANVTVAKVTVVGGGGNGSNSWSDGAGYVHGSGGGGGATAIKVCTGLTPSGSIAYSVGGAGTSSTFAAPGGTVTAGGGSAGAIGYLPVIAYSGGGGGGAGGVASGGDLNIPGERGDTPCGGRSMFGNGGHSVYSANGANGTGYGGGGGGGGAGSAYSGGVGSSGVIFVEY